MNYNHSIQMSIQGSPVGEVWKELTSPTGMDGWYGYYLGGKYLAIGENEDTDASEIYVSSDGISWQSIALTGSGWQWIAYGNGVYVITGGGSGGNEKFASSPDAITWTYHDTSPLSVVRQCVFGNDLFVVAHYNKTYTSPDGETWTERTQDADFIDIETIGFANGVFSAIKGDTDELDYFWISEDGITFTKTGTSQDILPAGDSLTHIHTVDYFILFCMFPSLGNCYFLQSSDGITWVKKELPAGTWNTIKYHEGVYMSVSMNEEGVIISSDGENWSTVAGVPTTNTFFNDVIISDDTYVVLSGYGEQSYYSIPDGDQTGGQNIFDIPKGYDYLSAINNTSNTVYIYQERTSNPDTRYALLKLSPFIQRTIPINPNLQYFTASWVQGTGDDYNKLEFIFATENLNMNGSLGNNSSDVTIVIDDVGIAKAEQFPLLPDEDRLKVVIKNTSLESVPVTLASTEISNLPASQVVTLSETSINNFPASQAVTLASTEISNFPALPATVVAIATILISESLSAGVALNEKTLIAVEMPPAWDTAQLSFQASSDGVTYYDLFMEDGAEKIIETGASKYVILSPSEFASIRYVKVRSGTTGAPVNQTAERVINLITKEV